MSQRYKASTSVAALRESDAYPEQFHTEKSQFTTLVGFAVVCSYLGNVKDERAMA